MEPRHTLSDLRQMQSLPLESKIIMTMRRIRYWYEEFDGNVHLSFSGGKDSTVLRHIIQNTVGTIPSVFVDTGLEYPETKAFVKKCAETDHSITIIRPDLSFKEVIEEYGYPVVSKEVSRRVYYARKAIANGTEMNNSDYKMLRGLAVDKAGNPSRYNCKKWEYLLYAPFHCSHKCCMVMKKRPLQRYQKATGAVPFIGTMACESHLRTEQWLLYGCNAYHSEIKSSQPMAFWTEQDVLAYIVKYGLDYAPIYGEIVKDANGIYHTTGVKRTGCMFCMFGCHLEKGENRFQQLARTHPKIHAYCIGGGVMKDGIWQPSRQGLGLARVLDYINVPYG